jgi:hypothetical protein
MVAVVAIDVGSGWLDFTSALSKQKSKGNKLPVSELPRSPSAIPNRLDMDGNDGLLTSSTGGDGGD